MPKKFNPRKVLENPANLVCICPDTDCEWHGNCKECIALHRYMSTIPNCLESEGETDEK